MTLTRRLSSTLALVLTLILGVSSLGSAVRAQSAGPSIPPVAAGEESAGRVNAPVTVVEYRSFVCPHCADWHRDVFAPFKARYVDTGKVRLVFRDMLTNPARTAAMGSAVVRCSAPERQLDVTEALFRSQSSIAPIPDSEDNYAFQQRVMAWLGAGMAVSGRTEAEVTACVQDPATLAAIRAQVQGGMTGGVQGTPTFFVNGRKIEGHGSMEELSAAIDPLLTR